METVGYLMSISTSHKDVEFMLAILNIAGRGYTLYGENDSSGSTDLWIIPKSNKSNHEIITQLQALPAIREVSVVRLSKPIKEIELAEVRELFAGIGWDARNVTNNELLLFLKAKLQGQYTYYIDHKRKKKGKELVKIRIRPAQEHPHFSPGMLEKNNSTENYDPDKVFTIDDIKIQTVTLLGKKQLK